MAHPFDEDIRLESPERGVAQGAISDAWSIVGRPHGGYLLAMALRAFQLELEAPDPLSMTAHFLEPGEPGPVRFETRVYRRGRGTTMGETRMIQDGRLRAIFHGLFGDLEGRVGTTYEEWSPPHRFDPDQCTQVETLAGVTAPLMELIDVRYAPPADRFLRGETGGSLECGGQVAFTGGRPMDMLGLACVIDAYPPTTFSRYGPAGWVPTLTLSVYFRRRPGPGCWVGAWIRTRCMLDGLLEEDGEFWDSEGRLLAQCRQLAVFRGRRFR